MKESKLLRLDPSPVLLLQPRPELQSQLSFPRHFPSPPLPLSWEPAAMCAQSRLLILNLYRYHCPPISPIRPCSFTALLLSVPWSDTNHLAKTSHSDQNVHALRQLWLTEASHPWNLVSQTTNPPPFADTLQPTLQVRPPRWNTTVRIASNEMHQTQNVSRTCFSFFLQL